MSDFISDFCNISYKMDLFTEMWHKQLDHNLKAISLAEIQIIPGLTNNASYVDSVPSDFFLVFYNFETL